MTEKTDTMQPHHVAGLFLERTGGYLLKAKATPTGDGEWHIEPEEQEPVTWDRESTTSVQDELKRMGGIVSAYRDEISGFSIASYGPFVSLTRGGDYGVIRFDTADPPLNGLDLYGSFGQCLGPEWLERKDTSFQIQTDASACAVGEAYFRGLRKDEVLAYLFVTEGVGIGLVQGRSVISNALHPEIGLLPAYVHRLDPLATKEKKRAIPLRRESHLDFHSIAQLSNNGALRARYTAMRGAGDQAFKFASEKRRERFWDIRACYLAQACVACTVVNPPHAIVIGADVDLPKDVDQRVWHYFEAFQRGWQMAGEPLFDYKGLADGFISRPSCAPGQSHQAAPAVTGAYGLCYLAAAASSDASAVSS